MAPGRKRHPGRRGPALAGICAARHRIGPPGARLSRRQLRKCVAGLDPVISSNMRRLCLDCISAFALYRLLLLLLLVSHPYTASRLVLVLPEPAKLPALPVRRHPLRLPLSRECVPCIADNMGLRIARLCFPADLLCSVRPGLFLFLFVCLSVNPPSDLPSCSEMPRRCSYQDEAGLL